MSTLIPADFFVLRTPALSWSLIQGWSETLESARALANGDDLGAAVERDARAVRGHLREILRRPEVSGALYMASPSLFARMAQWLDGDESEEARSVEPAVFRYVMRMAGRSTPFGLMAGCSFGSGAERTNLAVPPAQGFQRNTRLSLDWLYALAARISTKESVRPLLKYRTNSTLSQRGERLKFYSVRLESSGSRENVRAYVLSEMASTPFIEAAVAAGRRATGASMCELAEAIEEAFDGVPHDDALGYVRGLVDAQIFVSPLLPGVTGDDPGPWLLHELRELPATAAEADALESVLADVAAMDAGGPEGLQAYHERIVEKARVLSGDGRLANLLRVDLRKPSKEVALSRSVLREIASAAELVYAISPAHESPMLAFMRDFEARYQGREIPLLEALDPESGIGFDIRPGVDVSALIKGLGCEITKGAVVPWGGRQKWLLEKLAEALGAGATRVELSRSDVALLSTADREPLPVGQTAVVTLAAKSGEALDAGQYQIFLPAMGHTTSAALLGRFLHDDPELAAATRAALRKEEDLDRDAIHAEIAHHIEGLSTNVSCRPMLRNYEIDVAGGSGAPPASRIPLDDLLVSVRDGNLELRSRRHGRRVIPHLSSAQTYANPGLSIYRFLAHLQVQGVSYDAGWSWGPLSEAPFLPRVVHGRVVLSLATWRVPAKQIVALGALPVAERFRAIQRLRAERRLPRHVCLVDDDNVLPVDLESVASIDAMLNACKRSTTVVLRERFPDPTELVAHGPEGAFHHELLVPILRAPACASPATHLAVVSPIEPTPDRAKRPGQDWLFAKLYCGMMGTDRLLVELIAPLVREWRAAGVVDRWFYIRFDDPGLHVRLRLHGAPDVLWSRVAPRLFEVTSAARSFVRNVVIDTYDPEVERYGGEEAMTIAEQVFEADSDAALSLVERFRMGPEARWRAALVGMDSMLEDLGLSLAERRAVVAASRASWARKLKAGPEFTRQLGDKFRGLRPEIERLLGEPRPSHGPGAVAMLRRSAVLRRAASGLRELDHRGKLVTSFHDIARSYLHMWANRTFRGSINKHELVLYDFLGRSYESALARSRRSEVASPAAAEVAGLPMQGARGRR